MTDTYAQSAEMTDVRVRHGIAGQLSVSYRVRSGASESGAWCGVTLVGSVYGGPVTIVLDSGAQSRVSTPERFGDFATDPARYAVRFARNEAWMY